MLERAVLRPQVSSDVPLILSAISADRSANKFTPFTGFVLSLRAPDFVIWRGGEPTSAGQSLLLNLRFLFRRHPTASGGQEFFCLRKGSCSVSPRSKRFLKRNGHELRWGVRL